MGIIERNTKERQLESRRKDGVERQGEERIKKRRGSDEKGRTWWRENTWEDGEIESIAQQRKERRRYTEMQKKEQVT